MRGTRPELKALVAEASQALARLDAVRLEEMALSCAALNGKAAPVSAEEARAAVGEMAIFARVLQATRANLRVMQRLRELRMGRLEYSEPVGAGGWNEATGAPEGGDGDD